MLLLLFTIGSISVGAWVYAWRLNRSAERHMDEAQRLLNRSGANRYAIEAAENRAKDQKRVVEQLKAEANANRWRNAVLGGRA